MKGEKTGLSASEACLMIETSAKAGVVELQFNGLHVKFGTPAEQQVGIPYPFVPQVLAPVPVKALTEEQHTKQTQEAVEAEEVTLREDQLARLLVEDPVKYEQLLRDGELGNADGDSGADDGDDI